MRNVSVLVDHIRCQSNTSMNAYTARAALFLMFLLCCSTCCRTASDLRPPPVMRSCCLLMLQRQALAARARLNNAFSMDGRRVCRQFLWMTSDNRSSAIQDPATWRHGWSGDSWPLHRSEIWPREARRRRRPWCPGRRSGIQASLSTPREEVDLAPMRRTRREQGRVRPGSAGGFWLASGAACTHACEQAPRPGSLAACTSKAMAYEIEQAESTPNPWLGWVQWYLWGRWEHGGGERLN
jgi:hypothetical protein